MSQLKNVGVVTCNLRLPQQSYEHLVTYFNINNDPSLIAKTLSNAKFDLFGFLPSGFYFKDNKIIERILNLFNQNPQRIAFLLCPPFFNNGCAYFINTTILKIKEPTNTLSDIISLVQSRGLEAKQTTEDLFIYEH